jgi:hypothetical protein
MFIDINLNDLQKYLKNTVSNISLLLLYIFSSFCFGNIFGILSKNLGNNFFTILLTILTLEGISARMYLSNKKFSTLKVINKKTTLTQYFNVIKQGFLIGIYAEAFKVGS